MSRKCCCVWLDREVQQELIRMPYMHLCSHFALEFVFNVAYMYIINRINNIQTIRVMYVTLEDFEDLHCNFPFDT